MTNIETRYVDYASIPSLASALTDIDIVLSVLLIPGPEMETYQLNLLAAAEQAGVKRFAPSEFALPPAAQESVEFDGTKQRVWQRVQEAVEQGRIDAARFPTGMWMNYLAIGCPPRRREEGLAGFSEGAFLVHLDEDEPWIEIPVLADGTYPALTMTDLRDIGRFVRAAVDIEEPWGGRTLGMAGDTVGFGELVALCEAYVGKTVVQRREVGAEELRKRLEQTPPDDFMKRMETQIALVGCRDAFVVEPALNALCDVQPTTIQRFLHTYWAEE
ncbi:isoflavone reductase family protein [Aspergillus sp. HF37]|nr:isoflavone reductase family protein [Aspergillus sp. HF37]